MIIGVFLALIGWYISSQKEGLKSELSLSEQFARVQVEEIGAIWEELYTLRNHAEEFFPEVIRERSSSPIENLERSADMFVRADVRLNHSKLKASCCAPLFSTSMALSSTEPPQSKNA
jgi:hypothetical protein